MTPDRDRLLILTPHPSGALPADVLRDMLGEDAFDLSRRAAFLERLFMEGDPYTDLIYAVPGARYLEAPWSRFAVDLNRERDDRDDNGVVKLTDFARRPLYPAGFTLAPGMREARLRRIWDAFDAQVGAELDGAALMIVGHSMASRGPALGPDTGTPRPALTLMLGTGRAPTFPLDRWDALQAACADAFAPVLSGGLTRVAVGDPWTTDTLSARWNARRGVPAFGLEINVALYLTETGEPRQADIRALAHAFERFADAALGLVGGA
ncbi:N-formylglutamate amidohydrolase [Deinococcus metallilatus]|uniref:N-formylglutamate amidohydrolase n=1 Tax=Deinococcus metallilatus TaxID=1211322 RepID=A0AAJ5F680_9DEIO|nr:N-formylglutamate amidohydrolase [Deinococcus metallilatus]MBB5296060.1 N-formylglutamate amidohydrolase [Deinococcus metallilatus]QBY08130.1 N-formylglutamate amidohydrolase [Deinococcus metallilatus]RXJ11862.1 N-formylglutamate amidohydrolase [Deinococcus metallilatus]TLK25906.1 N-formylglutamate amidohydrolase [Deinococcus metallilatus]